ncbi:MAG: MFS transporter, partial [Chloroflexota bacterium]
MRSLVGLYALWAWLFAALGLSIAVFGPALPALRLDFGVSLAASGLLFSVHSVGYLLGVLVAGPLADARGRKVVTGSGAAALAAGMAFGAAAPDWPVLLAMMVLAGTGFAFVDVGLNAAIGDAVVGPGRRAAVMNLLHGAFPIGTLAGPAGLALAWSLGFDWRAAFLGTAAVTALALAGFAGRRAAWPRSVVASVHGHRPSRGVLRLLGEPYLRSLAAIQALYVGVEIGVAGWVATYLVEEFGAGEADGALVTAAYWAGFLIGRPAVAYLSHRVHPQRILPWLIVAGLAAGGVGVAAPAALVASAAYALLGVAISGVFPTAIALAQEGRHDDAGSVTALITAAAAVGGLTWPWLVGAVAQIAGLRAGMATAVAPLLPMLLIALTALR